MKKRMTAAVVLIAAGLIAIAAVMTAYHWDFSRLNTEEYTTETFEITEAFDGISIDTETADIVFAASDDDVCRVAVHVPVKVPHKAEVTDGTLAIRADDECGWFDYIGITLEPATVTVYLPGANYGSLAIRESTGNIDIPDCFTFTDADITVSTGDVRFSASVSETARITVTTGSIITEGLSADTLVFSSSTGSLTVSDVVCRSLSSAGSTGDAVLRSVKASEEIRIEQSTGDVRFDGSDAASIAVKTSTGSVTGTLLTEKVFVTETSTGDVRVPDTADGGICNITTSTGDIRIEIAE